jgi:hypothetical protein
MPSCLYDAATSVPAFDFHRPPSFAAALEPACGTNWTNRAGLTMPVDRGKAKVALWGRLDHFDPDAVAIRILRN